jgi:hypothetical protein
MYEHKSYTHTEENLQPNTAEHSLNDDRQTEFDKKITHKEERTISRTLKEREFIITQDPASVNPAARPQLTN